MNIWLHVQQTTKALLTVINVLMTLRFTWSNVELPWLSGVTCGTNDSSVNMPWGYHCLSSVFLMQMCPCETLYSFTSETNGRHCLWRSAFPSDEMIMKLIPQHQSTCWLQQQFPAVGFHPCRPIGKRASCRRVTHVMLAFTPHLFRGSWYKRTIHDTVIAALKQLACSSAMGNFCHGHRSLFFETCLNLRSVVLKHLLSWSYRLKAIQNFWLFVIVTFMQMHGSPAFNVWSMSWIRLIWGLRYGN
jgi:hypothetical protein